MGKSSSWRAPPGWRELREQVFRVKGRSCHWCGRYASTVDHLVPLILGGDHKMGNLVPACRKCNSSRGASLGNRLRGARMVMRRLPDAEPFTPSRDW